MKEKVMHLMIDEMTNLLKQVQELPECTPIHKIEIAQGIAKLDEVCLFHLSSKLILFKEDLT
jgi:hypothetical protein